MHRDKTVSLSMRIAKLRDTDTIESPDLQGTAETRQVMDGRRSGNEQRC